MPVPPAGSVAHAVVDGVVFGGVPPKTPQPATATTIFPGVKKVPSTFGVASSEAALAARAGAEVGVKFAASFSRVKKGRSPTSSVAAAGAALGAPAGCAI